jgi:hypothetical protein
MHREIDWPLRVLWLVLGAILCSVVITLYGCQLAVDAQGGQWALDAGELEPDASDVPRDGALEVAHDPVKRPPNVDAPDAAIVGELDAHVLEPDAGPELPPCNAEMFSAEGIYVQFSRVHVEGSLYECLPYPVDHLCERPGYEPGTGPDWRTAWRLVGYCRP